VAERFLDERVEVREADAVRTITFGSGHRLNPMTRWLVDALHDAVNSTDIERTRVVVLTGTPVFGCGAHLGELASLSDSEFEAFVGRELELARVVQHLPCLTVAALQGPCLGNAAELAMACDLRVATSNTSLGWPEIKAGFRGPAQQLLRYLNPAAAAGLLLTGDSVDAARALSMGLLTAIVPDDDPTGDRLVEAWAKLAPDAIRGTKQRLGDAAGNG
jgi:enoyl-CoA hydratase/carnithine racemase